MVRSRLHTSPFQRGRGFTLGQLWSGVEWQMGYSATRKSRSNGSQERHENRADLTASFYLRRSTKHTGQWIMPTFYSRRIHINCELMWRRDLSSRFCYTFYCKFFCIVGQVGTLKKLFIKMYYSSRHAALKGHLAGTDSKFRCRRRRSTGPLPSCFSK